MLDPNSPAPVLLAVLVLLEPKEKELALLAVGVEAPKRAPPLLVLLELEPNDVWAKEKPPDVPVLLTGWPKPLTWPNMGWPNPVPVAEPNPEEPNAVGAGAEGTEGVEEAGVAAGCPNTVTAVVVSVFAVV